MILFTVIKLVNISAINNTSDIFLLNNVTRRPIRIKYITALIFPRIIYPTTLVNAKNTIRYKKYLFVNILVRILGTFIYIYNV
jgi:hypothetical protein